MILYLKSKLAMVFLEKEISDGKRNHTSYFAPQSPMVGIG